MIQFLLLILLVVFNSVSAEAYLRSQLQQAHPGTYVVTAQNKNYTVLHIYEKNGSLLTLEEITVPMPRMKQWSASWREWVAQGAPAHTNWVLYKVNLDTGEMGECYSMMQRRWISIPQQDQFLPTLLNLQLDPIPDGERRKVGPPPVSGSPDYRPVWQPKMVVDGKTIPGVSFRGWRAHWPQDGTALSGKMIDLYVPENNQYYPAYFPYWLQVRGTAGQATVHIIDSGKQLRS